MIYSFIVGKAFPACCMAQAQAFAEAGPFA
jgi:hypothetical protein